MKDRKYAKPFSGPLYGPINTSNGKTEVFPFPVKEQS